MSHFNVLVVGNDPDRQLAPFQENNMGDCPPEYLEFEDNTKEYRKEYASGTRKEWFPERLVIRIPDPSVFEALRRKRTEFQHEQELEIFDSLFAGKEGLKGKRLEMRCGSRSFYVQVISMEILERHNNPAETPKKVRLTLKRIAAPKKVPFKQMYKTFEAFCKEWHGVEKDKKTGKYGYWTNPNTKWDWYELGGRWQGFFRIKTLDKITRKCTSCGKASTVEQLLSFRNAEDRQVFKCPKCRGQMDYPPPFRGAPGVFGKRTVDGELDTRADWCLIGDIDFDAMLAEADKGANETYDQLEAKVRDLPLPESWETVRTRYPDDKIDDARKEFHDQPWIKAVKGPDLDVFLDDPVTFYEVHTGGRQAYVEKRRSQCFQTFAVLKDGEWHEKGEMGWWGCVHNEKDPKEWNKQFHEILKALPPETPVSVYDCHI